MINKDFFLALEDLEREQGIKPEEFISWLETGLVSAYKKNFGEGKAIAVKVFPDKFTIKVYAYKTVVADVDFVPGDDTIISLSETRAKFKKTAKVGDIIKEEITPKEFGRIAAGTAKQIITQKLRESQRSQVSQEMNEKLDQITTGIVRRIENDTVYLELTGSMVEGVLMPSDQIPNEKYSVNDHLKVYMKRVKESERGSQAIVSRTAPNFVKKLFELEVPEIANGIVEIKNIVREAGYRTKIAVHSIDPNLDPLGACVGNKGMRVNNIVNELNGEKIDIIIWSDDPFEYIARALSPAKVLTVEVNDDDKTSRAIVPDDKLSLAIGKAGQNVRLAARLTGWKIDVKSVSQATEIEASENENIEDIDATLKNVEFENLDSMFEDVNLDALKIDEE